MSLIITVTELSLIPDPRLVMTVTKCFPSLETASGADEAAIQALNAKAGEIVVIGQDERNVGSTDPSQWWEEQRSVQELLVHPLCHPGEIRVYFGCRNQLRHSPTSIPSLPPYLTPI